MNRFAKISERVAVRASERFDEDEETARQSIDEVIEAMRKNSRHGISNLVNYRALQEHIQLAEQAMKWANISQNEEAIGLANAIYEGLQRHIKSFRKGNDELVVAQRKYRKIEDSYEAFVGMAKKMAGRL